MASTPLHFLLLCYLLFLSTTFARNPPHHKSLVLPITKDPSTNQYITHIKQRTPLTTLSLTVDLGGKHLWTDCETGYTSSTIRPGGCNTTQCRLAGASPYCDHCTDKPGPGCTNTRQCMGFPENTITRIGQSGELASDVVSINSTGHLFTVPHFLFFCAPSSIMESLAKGVAGMAGLGRTKISLPFQLASSLNLQKKFTLCLTPSIAVDGALLIGEGQYTLFVHAKLLTYTPLIHNNRNTEYPIRKGESSPEYYIGVESIRVNDKTVPINTKLLSINKRGYGGSKISTVHPYTVLETSIYNAVVEAFVSELPSGTVVAPVAPFGACIPSTSVGKTNVGLSVPAIDLVMKNNVMWRIYGANSMVQVNDYVMCLGVVDGGKSPYMTSVVIGGHQIEDNLLEFDVGESRLGFSSSLLAWQTSCGKFKFTSNA